MGTMGVMTLEIDNILRNIKEIRRAILSLEGPERQPAAEEIKELADLMEFKTRELEFELNAE